MMGLCGLVFYSVLYGQLPNMQHRAIILAIVAFMAVLVFPERSQVLPKLAAHGFDLLVLASVLVACGYVCWNYWDIVMDQSARRPEAVFLTVFLVLAILELSRRTIGWAFACLVVIFSLYALYGDLLPGRIGHGGVSLNMMSGMLFLSTDGVWGTVMDIFVSLLILFVFFSSLMMSTGAGNTMMNLAKIIGGRMQGGPAKIAVISSAMVGSMTGSSVTNVAMTGNFTIPMMKRLGYRPEVAAGIEATASSGGQITPPLMGAGLFLMAEFLGIEIGQMMLIALAPALLFYVGVLASVHFESLKHGVAALPEKEMPAPGALRRFDAWGSLVFPFGTMIYMIITGFSVDLAILTAILALILVHLSGARSLSGLHQRFANIFQALEDAAKPLVVLGVLCAAAGILIGVIGFVGIGIKFSDAVLVLAGGNTLMALVLAGIVVIVIGMGMPTTAAYLLAISVILTAFTKLGIPELSAHMFVFYFATLSAITPPVCAAVFVAAGLAKTSWLRTAVQTMRFAVIKYLLPFLFIFRPEILFQGNAAEVAYALVVCSAATVFISAAFAGYFFHELKRWQQGVMIVASGLLLWPDVIVNLTALPLVAITALGFAGQRAAAE